MIYKETVKKIRLEMLLTKEEYKESSECFFIINRW